MFKKIAFVLVAVSCWFGFSWVLEKGNLSNQIIEKSKGNSGKIGNSPSDKIRMTLNEILDTNHSFFKENGFALSHKNFYFHEEEFTQLTLKFKASRKASLEEARALELFLLHHLDVSINSSEKLKPYLSSPPFENIHVDITFTPGGNSVYQVENTPNTFGGRFRSDLKYYGNFSFKETFEEAVAINEKFPVENFLAHKASANENEMNRILNALEEQMRSKYGLEYRHFSWQGFEEGKSIEQISIINLTFVKKEKSVSTPQEDLREQIIFATETLLKSLNDSEILRSYLEEYPYPITKLYVEIPRSEGDSKAVTLANGEIIFYEYSKIVKEEFYENSLKTVNQLPLPLNEQELKTPNELITFYRNEIINAFKEDVEKEFPLIVQESSHFFQEREHVVDELVMSFKTKRIASKAEARALLLVLIDKLLQHVNSHEKIQPFLTKRPFTFSNIRLYVHFDHPEGWSYDGSVNEVNSDNRDRPIKKLHFFQKPWGKAAETFETATLRNQKNPDLNLIEHLVTHEELILNRIQQELSRELKREYKLEDVDFAWVWPVDSEKEHYIDKFFISAKRMSFVSPLNDEAENLVVLVNEKLLNKINRNEDLKPYLKNAPISSHQIEMELEFQDKKDRFFAGHATFGRARLNKGVIRSSFCYPEINQENSYQEVVSRAKSVSDPVKKPFYQEFFYGFLALLETLYSFVIVLFFYVLFICPFAFIGLIFLIPILLLWYCNRKT